jgi:hypothetical protein
MAGADAGRTLTTGYENTFIGKASGYPAGTTSGANLTTGYRNIIIGQRAATSANSDFRCLVIGYSAVGKGVQTGLIDVNGSIYQINNSASWATTSDRRLKKNIVDNNSGLEKLTQIQVRNFEYRLPEEITEVPQNQAIKKTGVQLGVIAQELELAFPELVLTNDDGFKSVAYDKLSAVLLQAIKEQQKEIEALKAKSTENESLKL